MPTRHTQMGRPTHEAPTREYTRKHTQTQTNAQRGPARYGAGSRRGTALLMMLALKPVSARAVRRDHGRTRQSRARRRAAAAVNTRAHRWGVHAPARRRTPRRLPKRMRGRQTDEQGEAGSVHVCREKAYGSQLPHELFFSIGGGGVGEELPHEPVSCIGGGEVDPSFPTSPSSV